MAPRQSVADLTDPYIRTLTAPPPTGLGVCDICHGAPSPGFSRCYSCARTTGQVSRPINLVVPISLYEVPGQLHHVLRNYRDGYTEGLRADLRVRVAALLWRFLNEHGEHIASVAGAPWDLITAVPSTQPRPGGHPLEAAIGIARQLAEQYEPTLERGDGPLDHNRASDTGYRVTGEVTGSQILLIDDTFTTGARVQSAASALTLAGANVLAAVPIGRVMSPSYSDAAKELWDVARSHPFDFGVCCLE